MQSWSNVCSLLLDDRRRLLAYLLHIVANKKDGANHLELPLGIDTLEDDRLKRLHSLLLSDEPPCVSSDSVRSLKGLPVWELDRICVISLLESVARDQEAPSRCVVVFRYSAGPPSGCALGGALSGP